MSRTIRNPKNAPGNHRYGRREALGLLALGPALAVALAACSSSSSSSSSAAAAGTASAAASASSSASGPASSSSTAVKSLGSATALSTLAGAPFLSTAPQTSIPFALGYWKSQGLTVTQQELGSTSTDASALALIASKPDQLMTAPVAPTSLMTAVAKGLPVIGVYVYMRQGLNSIYVLANSPIKTVAQLDGKTVGTYAPPPGGPYDDAKTIINGNGGNYASVKMVNIGYSPATMQQLKSGNAAAYVVTEPDYFTAIGDNLRQLPDKTFNQRFGYVFAVAKQQLQQNPKAVAALMKGFAEATLFAESNRTAALEVHWKMFPDSKTTGISQAEAIKQGLLSVSHRFDKYTVPSGQQYGILPDSDAKWMVMEQEAISGGEITKKLPVSDVFDSSLISQINDFDQAAVISAAKSYAG